MRTILHTDQGDIRFVEEVIPPGDGISRRKDIDLRVPNDGKRYVQFRPDWEVLGDCRQVVQGMGFKKAVPAIVNKEWGLKTFYNGVEYGYVPFPKVWQFFLKECFRWSVDNKIPEGQIEYFYKKPGNERTFAYATPNSLTWYYVNMIEAHRAFTEAGSPEAGYRDYVTGRNLSFNIDYQLLLRTCIFNIAQVTRDLGSEWELLALDILKPPPAIEWLAEQPHLMHFATEITTVKLSGGRYVVSPFPQAKVCSRAYGLPYMGTTYPFMSLGGTVRIKKTAVRLLEPGARYSLYLPEV